MKNRKPETGKVQRSVATFLLALGLAACAGPGGHPKDPLEPMNRATFQFNDYADKAVMRPVAQVYDMAPLPIRTGVGNFFGNVGDLWIGVNNLLQGKFLDGLSDGGRFLVNTTVGIFGVFDIASELGLEKHDEDFGQTLGRWGVGPGPYLVLPVLGPSTVRDTAALPVDLQARPAALVDDTRARALAVTLLQVVDTRAGLLGASRVLDDIALDKYSFLRDAYLARRRNQVYDGNPPEEPDEDADEPAK